MLHPENLEAQISAFDAYYVNKDGKLTEGELRQIACVFEALDKMGLTNEHSWRTWWTSCSSSSTPTGRAT